MDELYLEPEEHEVVLAVDHRTKPLYPTLAPGGISWHEYFLNLRARDKTVPVPVEAVRVLERAAEIDPATAPGNAGAVSRRLLARDWIVRANRSLVHIPAVRYLSDSEEDAKESYTVGDVRFADYDLETVCLLAVKRAPSGQVGFAMEATWERRGEGSLGYVLGQTFDPLLGFEIRVGYTKARKPNAIELEDGAEPPMGLFEWLAIVCPKPETTKKAKKKEAA